MIQFSDVSQSLSLMKWFTDCTMTYQAKEEIHCHCTLPGFIGVIYKYTFVSSVNELTFSKSLHL